MKIYKNGELLVTTYPLLKFHINHDTDVVSFGGGSVTARKGSPDWRIELDHNEVGILHHELDERRAKIRKAYEALTPAQRTRCGALMLHGQFRGHWARGAGKAHRAGQSRDGGRCPAVNHCTAVCPPRLRAV